jgi:hypothetical protein
MRDEEIPRTFLCNLGILGAIAWRRRRTLYVSWVILSLASMVFLQVLWLISLISYVSWMILSKSIYHYYMLP